LSLRVLPLAEREANLAACWYEDQRVGLGDDFLDEYVRVLRDIEQSPARFALLETIETDVEIRRAILKRFPYGIVYQVLPAESLVLAVMHLSRKPDYWIRRMA